MQVVFVVFVVIIIIVGIIASSVAARRRRESLDVLARRLGLSFSPKRDREAIFRSMQARRTFAATAKIVMDVRAGEHWMGECFDTNEPLPLTIHVKGTDTIDHAEIYMDGTRQKIFRKPVAELRTTFRPRKDLEGVHFFYVYVHQADGNQAWSSPIWMRLPK